MSKLFDSRLADVIRKPVITEKATSALDLNQYTFEVDHRAAKPQIKAAIPVSEDFLPDFVLHFCFPHAFKLL